MRCVLRTVNVNTVPVHGPTYLAVRSGDLEMIEALKLFCTHPLNCPLGDILVQIISISSQGFAQTEWEDWTGMELELDLC